MKEFNSIDEQISLLESRGMKFRDKELASRFLLRKNYYNTANVYGKYLVVEKGSVIFKENSNFDDICAMYDFEKKLRDLAFIMIMTIEANVSSTIAHLFCAKYKNENAYLEINNFCPTCKNKNLSNWTYMLGQISKIISGAEKSYKKNKIKNSIHHHLVEHGSVPLWVLINQFTFGNIIAFYRLLDQNLKQEIAQSFESMLTISYDKKVHLTPSEIQTYLNLISDLRNKIAHDSCLSVYRTPLGQHPKLNELNINEYVGENEQRVKFYDVILICRFFISKNAHYSLIDDIITEIQKLEDRLQDKSVMTQLMFDLGFNFYT
ncbi:Abi family protein [Erysipelothrix rhusiopathiae]|uniref:abortive infection resistance protein n=1 Tax=Erysipelothrix phage SE-1 TaxID=1675317 RepID=UPI00065F5939|nr:Abi family protein [Erysipelothrix rhusiopathiae]YP_009224237.1 abortive infection resistance protein [Erysipelothrix phage SE-1]AKQ06871.1 hypothetical protein [Erysipelothrix phage SE-1]MDE8038580.1 Abi family protein [Erysipelothrix rhusiopathiae]MDE8219504.1 Abi family protein [Erysipelothrix rhusiopathiae]MDE8224751.1 Abi family protein [Erysipelothrix rhusiopathiae]MDE8259109.1 Abi family protein [Erysipelothrix rhusiopathiae]